MKRVYVAGGHSADNVIEVLQNIGRGEEYASWIFSLDMAPFCPWHDKDFAMKLWNEDLTVEQFYSYSMAWLEVSDALFLVPGWEDSKGTLAEIERAKELNTPVFDDLMMLIRWRDESCGK